MFTGFASENTPAIQVWDFFRTFASTASVRSVSLANDCAPIQYFRTGATSTQINLYLPTAPIEGKQIKIVNAKYGGSNQPVYIFASDSSDFYAGVVAYTLGPGQTLDLCYSKTAITTSSPDGYSSTGWLSLNITAASSNSPGGVVLSGGVTSSGFNTSAGVNSVVAGGHSNNSSGLRAAVIGGSGNTAGNTAATVLGGINNNITGFYSAALASDTTSVSGTASAAIASSQPSTLSGNNAAAIATTNFSITNDRSAILGGSANTVSGGNSAVVGGSSNTVGTTSAVILGGINNTVTSTGFYSAILASDSGNVSGTASAAIATGTSVFGVSGNNAAAIATTSFSVTSDRSAIIGGSSNTVSLANSAIIAGTSNTSSGGGSVVVGGTQNAANALYSIVSGGAYGTTRSIIGNSVTPASNSPISTKAGVTQSATLLLGRITTDSTATALTSNASAASTTNQVILPNNSAYYFRGSVIAYSAGGDAKAWTFEGAIKRGATAASTAIVGTVILNVTASDPGGSFFGLTVTADTTNGGLAVSGVGQFGITVRWVCKVETTEVAYA